MVNKKKAEFTQVTPSWGTFDGEAIPPEWRFEDNKDGFLLITAGPPPPKKEKKIKRKVAKP